MPTKHDIWMFNISIWFPVGIVSFAIASHAIAQLRRSTTEGNAELGRLMEIHEQKNSLLRRVAHFECKLIPQTPAEVKNRNGVW
jgi:hypothetical protein